VIWESVFKTDRRGGSFCSSQVKTRVARVELSDGRIGLVAVEAIGAARARGADVDGDLRGWRFRGGGGMATV
jgi:hypothetical protein